MKKKESEKSKKKKISSGIAGLALTTGGIALNTVAGEKFIEELEKDPSEKSKKLYDKLKKNIKDRKIRFDDDINMNNASYSPEMKGIRNLLAKGMKEARKGDGLKIITKH